MMHDRLAPARRQQGLSLIEMMIAMVIGLMLIGSAVMVFSGTRRSSELNRTLSQMQEGGRFALDSMVSDIRMAGFQGCVDWSESPAKIRANSAPSDDLHQSSLVISQIDAGGIWTPDKPDEWNAPVAGEIGHPLSNTQAIMVQFGGPETWPIEAMSSISAPVVVDSPDSTLVSGDLAIISDCLVADLFEISSNTGSSLSHDATENRGDARLSAQYGLPTLLTPVSNARVMRFESNIYYIGNTQRTHADGSAVYALYRQSLPYNDTNPPQEMVEGVEHLKFRIGIRPDSDNANLIRYIEPLDSVGLGEQIRTVQFGMLLASPDPVLDEIEDRSFVIAEQTIAAGGSHGENNYRQDRRMRITFNASVAVRNRYE